MDYLDLEAPGLTAGNVEKIAALFPAAVTETQGADGKVKKAVNFEVLKQLLAPDVAEGEDRYEFTWVGKRAAMAEAARPTSRTLRPVKADSRDWDTTRNLYIEGDNLEVLKILQESYLGAVKVIYLDPPYNTGSDFIYPDSFVMDRGAYHGASGYRDAEGKINFQRKNTFSDGRYHSDWCSMLFSRLLLARSLLSPDGVILISIDDHESANLKKICDEVFGESNYLNQFAWVSNITGRQISGRGAAKTWESVLAYARDIDACGSLSATLGGAEDPAAAAELYGGLHALVWTGMPALEKLVVIRDPGIHLGIDFDAQETRAEGELGISIRLGTLIAVGTQLAVPAIGWLRRFMKRRRMPPASKAADNKAAEHPAA